jgi:magnesium-transporting ATPase (P-type)
MGSRPITTIAAVIFFCIALVHVYRVFTQFQIIIGSHSIPMWISYFGIVIPALLAILLLRESRA